MEQKIGRVLEEKEVVHHINRNKLDNRVENLVILTPEQHSHEHAGDKSLHAMTYWPPERRKAFGDRIRAYRREHYWSASKGAKLQS